MKPISASMLLIALIFSTGAWASPAVVHGNAVADGQAPYVVKIVGLDSHRAIMFGCTGEFISDSLLLTAGHCVQGNPTLCLDATGNEALQNPICATRTLTQFDPTKETQDREDGVTLDLGLAWFPRGTAPAIAPLATDSVVSVGQDVDFIGYGTIYESFTDAASALIDGPDVVHKNIGHSTIDSIDAHFYGLFAKETKTFADDGDSGSALIFDGKVIGIFVTAYLDDHVNPNPATGDLYGVYNQAVRLDTPEARAFLQENP